MLEAVYISIGRGDSSHLVIRGDSSNSPLWEEKNLKKKKP